MTDPVGELLGAHPCSTATEVAQVMIGQLDVALHGYSTARAQTPRAYWAQLLAEVERLRQGAGP